MYNKDAYIKETDAEVTEITDQGVVFNQTVFYPRGGGQASDRGVVIYNGKEIPVIKVQKISGKVYHSLAEPIAIGEKVHLKIDWDHRYRLMKLHTALHIMSAIADDRYHAKVTGGDIKYEKARLDFDFQEFNKELAEQILTEVNEEIQKDHKISVSFVSRAELETHLDLLRTKVNLLPPSVQTVRIVAIGDLDRQADGGLHVHSTKEIGKVALKKISNQGKGRKRITITIAE